jgi:hypothetical protein
LMRNVFVAIGNSGVRSGEPRYKDICARLAQISSSEDPILAEHARWALTRLGSSARIPQPAVMPVVPPKPAEIE